MDDDFAQERLRGGEILSVAHVVSDLPALAAGAFDRRVGALSVGGHGW